MQSRLIFDVLTEIAIDAAMRRAWLEDPARALAQAGLTPEEVRAAMAGGDVDDELVANGDFAACQSCGDPGPDPFPEHHERRVSG
jgi:hypothetical protein